MVQSHGKVRTSQWVPLKNATPGEVIRYELQYANAGDEAATDAVIEDPIPAGTTYVPGSASGEGAELSFSTDGGKTFVPASALATDAGAARASPAITHVRWTVKRVAPGQSGKVSLRVQVNR